MISELTPESLPEMVRPKFVRSLPLPILIVWLAARLRLTPSVEFRTPALTVMPFVIWNVERALWRLTFDAPSVIERILVEVAAVGMFVGVAPFWEKTI